MNLIVEGKQVMTTNNPTDAEIDARVEAELKTETAQRRAEIARRIRVQADLDHLKRVNARHPTEDKYGGLGPEGHAARLKAMDERAQANREHMARVNGRAVR
jgi:hypothetical protein